MVTVKKFMNELGHLSDIFFFRGDLAKPLILHGRSQWRDVHLRIEGEGQGW